MVENRESYLDAVYREVKEETNLDVKEVFDLRWGSVYSWGGKDYRERNFLAFVRKGNIKLNEEHVDFSWLNLERFIERISWGLDKTNLKSVLEKSLKKQLFFDKVKMEEFSK
jgi:8-oxo-dGTP pyrophosphatase MutT (NUDIX family)